MSKTIIFGATGHMGQAIARQMVAAGKPVHLAGRDDEALGALATELGVSASLFDLNTPDTLDAVISEASADGQLAGLVWAVGSILLKPLNKLSAADFVETYQTNVVGAALAVKAAQTALKSRQGECGVVQLGCRLTGVYQSCSNWRSRPVLRGWQKLLQLSFRLMFGSMSSHHR